jgi:hypothetical protein
MPTNPDLSRRMREALANCFPDRARASLIAQDAGLSPAQIDLSGPPVVFWQNILYEAGRRGKIASLLERAICDAPAAAALVAVRADYVQWQQVNPFAQESWTDGLTPWAVVDFEPNMYLERILQRDEFEVGCLYVDMRTRGQEVDTKPLLPFEIDMGRSVSDWISDDERAGNPARRPIRMMASEALEKYSKLVILGDSGTGKTFLLLRALRFYAQKRKDGAYGLIPVYLPLRAYRRDQQNLDSLISEALRVADWRVLPYSFHFLLDGFNEIPDQDRDEALRELQELLGNVAHRYVITTRKAGYTGDPIHSMKLQEMELALLNREEMAEFVNRYLTYLGDAHLVTGFMSQLEPAPGIRALSSIPLFLAILLRVYDSKKVIPANHGLLYKQFLDVIYEWERKRGKDQFGAIKTAILSDLAFEMIAEGHRVYVFTNEAQSIIHQKLQELEHEGRIAAGWTAENVYRELVDNRLLHEEKDMVGFLHQTMQEFFAALEIRERGLLDDASYVSGDRWHPSLVYLSGLLRDSSSLVQSAIAHQELGLAIECFNVAQRVDDAVDAELSERCCNEIAGYLYRWDIGMAAGESWGWSSAYPHLERFGTNAGLRVAYIQQLDIVWTMRSDRAKRELARLFIEGEYFPEKSRCILCRKLMAHLGVTHDHELLELFRQPLLESAEPCCEEVEPDYAAALKRFQVTS